MQLYYLIIIKQTLFPYERAENLLQEISQLTFNAACRYERGRSSRSQRRRVLAAVTWQTETNFISDSVSDGPKPETNCSSHQASVSQAPGSEHVHLLLQLVTSAALLLQLLSQQLHVRLLFKFPQLLLWNRQLRSARNRNMMKREREGRLHLSWLTESSMGESALKFRWLFCHNEKKLGILCSGRQHTHVGSVSPTRRFLGDLWSQLDRTGRPGEQQTTTLDQSGKTHRKDQKLPWCPEWADLFSFCFYVTDPSGALRTWESLCCSPPSPSLSSSESRREDWDLITISSEHSVSDVFGDSARSTKSSRFWPRKRILSRCFRMVATMKPLSTCACRRCRH